MEKGVYTKKRLDLAEVQAAAITLRDQLLAHSAQEPVAASCLRALTPILDEVFAGRRTEPYERVPCGYDFNEGVLREYVELASAYSRFAFLAEGGDEEAAKRLVDELRAS